jgi:hypothetical protein
VWPAPSRAPREYCSTQVRVPSSKVTVEGSYLSNPHENRE